MSGLSEQLRKWRDRQTDRQDPEICFCFLSTEIKCVCYHTWSSIVFRHSVISAGLELMENSLP